MTLNEKTLVFPLGSNSSLLINPLTGAIDIVPDRVLHGDMDNYERGMLEKRGYFLKESKDAMEQLKEVYDKHSQHVPYWFYVLTTLNCNFSCPICYERRVLENASLSEDTLNEIIIQIKMIQSSYGLSPDRIRIVVFGGEPLLASKDSLSRLFRLLSDNGWKCVIVTNGSRVPAFMDLFDEYSETISDFRITIDGLPHIHNSRRPYRDGSGSFYDVVQSIDILLEKGFEVKMQTILGSGNLDHLSELGLFITQKRWTDFPNFQWRIEGSHDYANLDILKDEVSEAVMVRNIIKTIRGNPALQGKMKFESFKYLAHLTNSFGWLGNYKTYWGPKFGFCEPQKGFHFVFSVDGKIYHCPRTISNPDFCIGKAGHGVVDKKGLKGKTVLDRDGCKDCRLSTLCGGGCVVQRYYNKEMDCQEYVYNLINEFIRLMEDDIMKDVIPGQIKSINETWL